MAVSGLSGAVWVLPLLLSWARCSPLPAPGVEGPFLRVLNRSEAPEYMLELYERFNNERGAPPAAGIVRSFRNQDPSSDALQFNISVPQQERVVSAELRLHVLLQTDSGRSAAAAAGWKVSVFESRCRRRPLASKLVQRRESGWEAFDVTGAVQHWRKANALTPRLEVSIQNLLRDAGTALDVDRSPDGKHQPALIVFSDDSRRVPRERRDEAPSRVRRAAKTDGCRKAEMYVDFKDIGWDSFVLAPSGYQAFTCRGACNYPLTRDVTPTKHAVVQTLLNLKSPQRAARACCVPTELKPISLLYENENGVVVLNNKYEGMVVKECGCR